MVPPNTHYEKKGCALQPPDIMKLHFRPLNVFPDLHVLDWKRPPFCKLRPKRVWNYACLARKIQFFFLGKMALPPCNPHQEASPWTPVNASRKRSVCSLRSQLFEPPMLKIFLSLWWIAHLHRRAHIPRPPKGGCCNPLRFFFKQLFCPINCAKRFQVIISTSLTHLLMYTWWN